MRTAWNRPAWAWQWAISTWMAISIFQDAFSDDTNVFVRTMAREFDDVTLRAGLGVETSFVCWGGGIADFDNDGNPDLLYVTGNVYPEIEARFPTIRTRRRALYFAIWAMENSKS